MTFEDYQKSSRETAIYGDEIRFTYTTMGLASEAGEFAGKMKKILRDDHGIISEEKKVELAKELGDVLWYIAQLATELGLSLETIAKENLEKLFSRKERGVLSGSGDNR